MEIRQLTIKELKTVEKQLEIYDAQHVTGDLHEIFQFGCINDSGKVIAGVFATSTAYNIVYISILWVHQDYRRQGVGRLLMETLEKKARDKGASFIRLDTFDWQGKAFYQALGYEEVGSYASEAFGFSEHFFLKRL